MASAFPKPWKKPKGLGPAHWAPSTTCFVSSSLLLLLLLLLLGFLLEWNELLLRRSSHGGSPSLSLSLHQIQDRNPDERQENVQKMVSSDFGILGVPWCRTKNGANVPWTRDDLLKGLKEFAQIYINRPIPNNKFGMGFDHSFGLWFMARWIQPDLMIESGAFKGHSTWVLRQAMPDKPIISITPRHPKKYLQKGPAYVDSNCKYYAGRDFVDFGSINWKDVLKEHGIKEQSRVFLFFDDHQSELRRFQQALEAGFQHLVFEDNYDTGTGDHYSLRQICDQPHIKGGGHNCSKDSHEAHVRATRSSIWEKAVNVDELCGVDNAWWGVRGQMRDNFNHSFELISENDHLKNSQQVEAALELYWELPPIADPSLTHQTRYDPFRTSPPLIKHGQKGLFKKLGLSTLDKDVFNGYTQMVYLKISQNL